MKKLFKKLNEQIEINNIQAEAEENFEELKEEIETKVIFEDQNNKILETLAIED